MKRHAAEIIGADKLKILHAVVEVIFDLDEPLRQLCLALLALHERQSVEAPGTVLERPINLHAEHFDDLLPLGTSITLVMRRLQLENPHVNIPTESGSQHLQSEAPLFEIVSSLELAGTNPRINWWVRAGQWSLWGLTPFDRQLLCRFATTVISEKDPKYHGLLALLTLAVALRVDEASPSDKSPREAGERTIEISVDAIRDDLIDLEKMVNFLPVQTDIGGQAGVAVDDFVDSKLLRYTDESHKTISVLRLESSSERLRVNPEE